MTRMTIGPRIDVQHGAQGVVCWMREINGVYYGFQLVYAGWWGVGETGSLTVTKPDRVFNRFPVHHLHV